MARAVTIALLLLVAGCSVGNDSEPSSDNTSEKTTDASEEPRDLLGVSDYGGAFCAAAGRENLAAVQFHPEKSSVAGLKFYENFLLWARSL